jgi:hypothetical protein
MSKRRAGLTAEPPVPLIWCRSPQCKSRRDSTPIDATPCLALPVAASQGAAGASNPPAVGSRRRSNKGRAIREPQAVAFAAETEGWRRPPRWTWPLAITALTVPLILEGDLRRSQGWALAALTASSLSGVPKAEAAFLVADAPARRPSTPHPLFASYLGRQDTRG